MALVYVFFFSLSIVLLVIPPLIKLAVKNQIYDDPTESRRVHKYIIPNLGGVAIFISFLLSCLIFIPSDLLPEANLLMAGAFIVFIVGLKDDFDGLSPLIKFIGQIISAIVIVSVADIRITSFQGIFGVFELPYLISLAVTILFFVGTVNSFNLIDGIDGLAGSLGVILSLVYACIFFNSGEMGWAYLSIALTGALTGFLFFNITPAKIFMGDSGSLFLGFVAAILSMEFMSITVINKGAYFGTVQILSGVGLSFAIIVIPIFDTLRVFLLRVIKNISPFKADNNHLHHRLLYLGLSHLQATFVLSIFNFFLIIMALLLQHLGNLELIFVLSLIVLSVNGLVTICAERYARKITDRPALKVDFMDNLAKGGIGVGKKVDIKHLDTKYQINKL
jgi:UDP-GlcNAc:undecaprenyl-phosphate GlcNAc-1-phosphate transferase